MYTNGIESLDDVERYILSMVEQNNKLSLEIGKGMKIVKEYVNEAEEVLQDDSLLESYDKEQAWKDMWYEEGIEKGEYQKAIEIAKAMLEKKIPISEIETLTKLPSATITELQSNHS